MEVALRCNLLTLLNAVLNIHVYNIYGGGTKCQMICWHFVRTFSLSFGILFGLFLLSFGILSISIFLTIILTFTLDLRSLATGDNAIYYI